MQKNGVGQWSWRLLGIIGKSNRLQVDILRFSFIKLGYILQIPLKWSVIVLQSWTSTGYFSNSTGSFVTKCRFSPTIGVGSMWHRYPAKSQQSSPKKTLLFIEKPIIKLESNLQFNLKNKIHQGVLYPPPLPFSLPPHHGGNPSLKTTTNNKCNSHTDNHSQIQVANQDHPLINLHTYQGFSTHMWPPHANPGPSKFPCGSVLSEVIVIIIIMISPYNKGPTRAQATHSSHIYILLLLHHWLPDSKDPRRVE